MNVAIPAFAAGAMRAIMLLVSLFSSGVTAQDFEMVRDMETYTRAIVAAETPLRLILTLDNLFLTLHTAAFVFLAMAVRDERILQAFLRTMGGNSWPSYVHERQQNE
jgi:hypothetical protein